MSVSKQGRRPTPEPLDEGQCSECNASGDCNKGALFTTSEVSSKGSLNSLMDEALLELVPDGKRERFVLM